MKRRMCAVLLSLGIACVLGVPFVLGGTAFGEAVDGEDSGQVAIVPDDEAADAEPEGIAITEPEDELEAVDELEADDASNEILEEDVEANVDPIVSAEEIEPVVVADEGAQAKQSGADCSRGLKAQMVDDKKGTKDAATKSASILYRVHVQSYGDMSSKKNGAVAGTTGKSKRMEAIWIKLGSKPVTGGVKYRTHVQSHGWQNWVEDGAKSGTTGKSKRMEAIQIQLTGQMAKKYDIWYRVHVQTYGWMGWAKNGARAGTEGMSRRLEAIQIKLVSKGGAAPGSTTCPFKKDARARMVLIGDSRTLGTYHALYGVQLFDPVAVVKEDASGNWWVARYGGAYNWFANIGVDKADTHITSDTAVVIQLGVNDCISLWGLHDPVLGSSDETHYAFLINRKAKQWKRRGAMVYYATVAPVGSHRGDNTYVSETGKRVTNAQVQRWNDTMRSLLSSDVTVLDAYGAVAGNYRASDSLHYDDATYRRLFEFVRSRVT